MIRISTAALLLSSLSIGSVHAQLPIGPSGGPNTIVVGSSTITGTTVSGSATGPAFLTVQGTWNTSGVVDAALVVNVTNTMSDGGSFLADFQLSGVSKFGFREDGLMISTGGVSDSANTVSLAPGAGIELGNAAYVLFSSTANYFGTADTAICRSAAGTVKLGTAAGCSTPASLSTATILPGVIYSAAGTALPTCNAGTNGATAVASDITTATYRAAYVSGGANTGRVFCISGTGWVSD